MKAQKTNIVAGTVFGVHPAGTVFGVHPFNGETNFRGGTIDGGRPNYG